MMEMVIRMLLVEDKTATTTTQAKTPTPHGTKTQMETATIQLLKLSAVILEVTGI
jgi:hypothetical protein